MKNIVLPSEITLNKCEVITDVPKFLQSHLDILNTGRKNWITEMFESRLTKAWEIILKHNETILK